LICCISELNLALTEPSSPVIWGNASCISLTPKVSGILAANCKWPKTTVVDRMVGS
jgi:hypothetical protein